MKLIEAKVAKEFASTFLADKILQAAVNAVVDNCPTVDAVEVVHGRWVQCFEDWRKQFEGDECSACGFQIYGGVSHFKYCPNCGAKMDLEKP